MSMQPDHAVFEAGDVRLQSGETVPGLQLTYKTYGKLNAAKDNAILYPTSFGAQHGDIEWLIQPGSVLDPGEWFVIIANQFGNGLSSSPSNFAPFQSGARFPTLTYHDAVTVQRKLIMDVFGISRLAMVYGFSMGGMQAYHWATCHPEMVERVAVVCGSARCSPFNQVFLESVRAALTADPAYRDGRFVEQPVAGFRAMGRVYAGWALSHAFYRDELWRDAGFTSLEDYLSRSWDSVFARRDANDVLTQLGIWQRGDVSQCEAFGGDLRKALAAVTARVLLMPGSTDCYFQVSDNENEVPLLVNARSATLAPIVSPYGHRAGNPMALSAEREFLTATIRRFLQS